VPALLSTACGGASVPTPLPEPTPVTTKAFLYALTDLDHTIRGFEVVPEDGTLKPTFTLAGSLRMSADPDGRWLFVCGREDGREEETLQTHAIDREDGALSFLSSISTELVSPKATRGVVFGGFWWRGPSGKEHNAWVAYRVDPATGRLAVPGSREWALRGRTCGLAVGAASDFAFADCEPYYDDHAFRTWSIEPEGRWHEVDALELPRLEEPYDYVVCGDKLLTVIESWEDIGVSVGVSVFAVDSATGRLSYRTRTVLDLRATEKMTCGPGGLVAIGDRLFRVDEAGSLGPVGSLGIPAGPRLAFHPAGGFLYGWREDPQQSSLVTLAVAGSGETRPFAETAVAGHMGAAGTIVVTRPTQ
jgi:hypothetical protein